jgi:ABC-type transport system involved in Fe-S cluster assembly fused permease/ATPase subunit
MRLVFKFNEFSLGKIGSGNGAHKKEKSRFFGRFYGIIPLQDVFFNECGIENMEY